MGHDHHTYNDIQARCCRILHDSNATYRCFPDHASEASLGHTYIEGPSTSYTLAMWHHYYSRSAQSPSPSPLRLHSNQQRKLGGNKTDSNPSLIHSHVLRALAEPRPHRPGHLSARAPKPPAPQAAFPSLPHLINP